MGEIKAITVVAGNGESSYFRVGTNGVTKIQDDTVMVESSIKYIYSIYDKDGMTAKVIDCPYIIEYK